MIEKIKYITALCFFESTYVMLTYGAIVNFFLSVFVASIFLIIINSNRIINYFNESYTYKNRA